MLIIGEFLAICQILRQLSFLSFVCIPGIAIILIKHKDAGKPYGPNLETPCLLSYTPDHDLEQHFDPLYGTELSWKISFWNDKGLHEYGTN